MPDDPATATVARAVRDSIRFTSSFAESGGPMQCGRAAEAAARSLREGGKLLACGNGGSCADALHFCEELTGRYRRDRRPLAAIACVDPGHLTCTANDYGYEQVFSRWIEAIGRPGDAVVLLSTSGRSANIVRAAEAAGRLGLTRIALLGGDGGVLAGLCEHEVTAPGETADRIQEIHMLALHAMIEVIESALGLA